MINANEINHLNKKSDQINSIANAYDLHIALEFRLLL